MIEGKSLIASAAPVAAPQTDGYLEESVERAERASIEVTEGHPVFHDHDRKEGRKEGSP